MIFVGDDIAHATHLLWAVKASFLDYVAAQPDHEMTSPEGCLLGVPAYSFNVMAQNEAKETRSEGRDSFCGTVRFEAHDGALEVNISNPSIEYRNDSDATLLIDSPGTANSRIAIARLSERELSTVDGVPAIIWKAVVLTLEGADFFGGFYNPRTRLSPVAVLQNICLEPSI